MSAPSCWSRCSCWRSRCGRCGTPEVDARLAGAAGAGGVPSGDRGGNRAGQPHDRLELRRDCLARRWSCADGVPASLRTLVAVPTLLTSEADLLEQIERLEVHHLSGAGGDLTFALLTDGLDADQEALDGDAQLLARRARGHRAVEPTLWPGPRRRPRFFLLHRRRLFNAGEGMWMGWERKRGKLHELNRLLRGATDTSFVPGPDGVPQLPAGRALRHHAGCRHPPAARCRAAADRQDGASAEPAALRRRRCSAWSAATRSCSRASPPRCRSAARARSTRRSSPRPAASTLMRRPSPTSTRTSSAKAPTPARASTTSMPSRPRSPAGCRTTPCSAMTCSRASSPAPGWPPTSKWSRNFRPATTSPPSASIAGRAATGNCCPGSSARAPRARRRAAIGLGKMLDNLRRSLLAPVTLAVLGLCWLLPWPPRRRRFAGPRRLAIPPFLPPLFALVPRRAGIRAGASHLRMLAGDLRLAALQSLFLAGVPARSGLAHGRCHRADAGAAVRDAAPPARMDDGRAVRRRPAPGSARLLPADGRRHGARAGPGGRGAGVLAPASWPLVLPFAAALAGRAGAGLVGQPLARGHAAQSRCRRRRMRRACG